MSEASKPFRLYSDQLRGLATFIDELPDAMGTIRGFGEHNWIGTGPNPLYLADGGVEGKTFTFLYDYEAESWYVEIGDDE